MNDKAIESGIINLLYSDKEDEENWMKQLPKIPSDNQFFLKSNRTFGEPTKNLNEKPIEEDGNAFLTDPKVYRIAIVNLEEDYASEDALRSICRQFGPIHHTSIEKNAVGNNTRFVGLIDFFRLGDAVIAKDKLLEMKGWKIFFTAEKKKDLRTLYVSNFPKYFNHYDLRNLLEESGKIRSVRVFGLGQPTMIAFVTCENVFEAKKILSQNNGRKIGDSKKFLKVKYANINPKKRNVNVHGISGDFCTPPSRNDSSFRSSDSSDNESQINLFNLPSKSNSTNINQLRTTPSSETLRRVNSGSSLTSVSSTSTQPSSNCASSSSVESSHLQFDESSFLEKICFESDSNFEDTEMIPTENCRLVDFLLDSNLLKGEKAYKNISARKQLSENVNLFLAVTINGVPALIPANYAVSLKVIPEKMLKKKGWIAKPIILNRKYDDYNLFTDSSCLSDKLFQLK